MNTSDEQNGRQPPVPLQPPAPSSTRPSTGTTTNSDKPKEICRNFFWGTCSKSSQCKYRHELDFEEMKKHLKFCHDYQNPSGCIRDRCTYLHATKDEEKLFRATGQLPRVLAERHANIMSATTVETIPLIASFINEALAGGPPPPPPPLLPMLQLPPPPPPTQPSTSLHSPVGPIYTAPPLPGAPMNFMLNQPPPAPPIPQFDASRPPPPIPSHVLAKNSANKRASPIKTDVGASKLRKLDDSKVADTLCEQCLQRDIRIESCRQEVNKLSRDEEYLIVTYKKKLEEYENRKEILRSLVSSEQYRFVEDYVDGGPQLQVHDVIGQLNQPQFISGVSTVPKQFLLQLLDCAIGNRRSFDSPPSPSFRLDEILQTLGSAPRRQNSISHTSPEILQTFAKILRTRQGVERAESEPEAAKTFSGSNGAAAYAAYQPAVPPPPKPYYAAPYPAPPTTSFGQGGAETAGAGAGAGAVAVAGSPKQPAVAVAAADAAAGAGVGRNCHQYAFGRYPPPHFYQPFQ